MIPTIAQMRLSWWMARVSPSIVASGATGIIMLHAGFGVPWRRSYTPAVVFMMTYTLLCVGMFWARKQVDRNRGFGLAVGLMGVFLLITVLLGMWYGGDLGIVSSRVFVENRIPFTFFSLISTSISVGVISFWKPFSTQK